MSEHFIVLIPVDPRFVPEGSQQRAAAERFAAIAPDADLIEPEVTEGIRFVDCGANLERIECSACGSEIEMSWWMNQMDSDYEGGTFKLESYEVPCCQTPLSLADLAYEWPQGFGRFGLRVRNANIGRLTAEQEREFAEILGTPIRAIYQHI